VFFAQLALGLAGLGRFLMSGALHVPVPAVILAGPVYRGEGLFMPILFGAALLLVGPAWCSHLCYFGALDAAAADARRRPGALPGWARIARWAVIPAVAGAALGLRLAGARPAVAAGAGIAFGVAGLGAMIGWSRRRGLMGHCTWLCPMGALATTLGKMSPFRLRLADGCDGCGACAPACRYGALAPADLERPARCAATASAAAGRAAPSTASARGAASGSAPRSSRWPSPCTPSSSASRGCERFSRGPSRRAAILGSMRRPLTPFDIVGLAFAILGLAWALAAAHVVAPTFARMYAELCCGYPCLPAATSLLLSPWTDLALGLAPFAFVLLAWALRARRGVRAAAMVAAVLWVVAQPVAFFLAMYLPLISLSEAML